MPQASAPSAPPVSIVTDSAVDALLVPAEFVAVAVSEWPPLASVLVVTLQAPFASAVAVPTCVEPSNTFTVLLAVAVPVRVSVLSLVIRSPATPLSVEKLAIAGVVGGVVTGGGVVLPGAEGVGTFGLLYCTTMLL